MKIVSASPHLHSGNSTQKIMRDVIIAMLPALAFSIYSFGLPALYVTLVSVAMCVGFEWFCNKVLLKRENSLCDLSAVVTGILLAFNLPSGIPLWIVAIGAIVAIGVGKMSFGGLGRNPFNPALVGRVFLLISFPVQMTSFSYDGVSGATPLGLLKEKGVEALSQIQLSDMLFGLHGGSLGEVGGILLILGGLYLLWRKVITWHIPVFVLGTMAVFAEIMFLLGDAPDVTFHIFAGGAILGAFFMATDYSSSPMSKKGAIIYAIGIGLITMLVRTWGAYPEGMSFAILIMNATVPLLNIYCKPRRFGKVAKK